MEGRKTRGSAALSLATGFVLLLAPAPLDAADGFLKTSRGGDLIIEFVSSSAAAARMEFGLGTPDRNSSADERRAALVREGSELVTPMSANMGYFPPGSALDFYMVCDWGGESWAFSRNLAGTPTAEDLATFRDPDRSLGFDGSIVEKRGPDDWILHMDDPSSVRVDDDDNDFVVRVRIVSHQGAGSDTHGHPGGLHTPQQIRMVKAMLERDEEPFKTAFEALIEKADANLKRKPHAVETFEVPLYYQDKDGHVAASKSLNGDGTAAYACALAWQLTGQVPYAEKAREILNAWARTNRRYSGQNGEGADRDSTLVMAYAGVALVHAAELISDYEKWTADERQAFKAWLEDVFVAACLARTMNEKAGSNRTNWALLGLIAAHHFLDDQEGIDTLVGWLKLEIDKQIAADGHLDAETDRGAQGMWYTYFGLAPLTAACMIAWNSQGVDLFHYTVQKGGKRVGIQTALDYYLDYCRHPEQWPWYRNDDLRKPRPDSWPGNLFEAMAAVYGAPRYEEYAKEARPHTMTGHHFGWAFPTLMRPLPVEPEKKPEARDR